MHSGSVQNRQNLPSAQAPLAPDNGEGLSGLGARVQDRAEGIPEVQNRENRGFIDVRRLFSEAYVRLRIGLVLIPALTLMKIAALLSRSKSQGKPAAQVSPTGGRSPAVQKKRVRFAEDLSSGYVYDSEESSGGEDVDQASSIEEDEDDDDVEAVSLEEVLSRLEDGDSVDSILFDMEEDDNIRRRQTSEGEACGSSNSAADALEAAPEDVGALEERRVALETEAKELLRSITEGDEALVLIPEPKLGVKSFSVPGSELIVQHGISFQSASVCMFCRDVLLWISNPKLAYRKRPRRLEGLSESDCSALRDQKEVLLSSLPRIYAVQQLKDGGIAVVRERPFSSNNGSFFEVELGPERESTQELSARYGLTGFPLLRLKLASFFGGNRSESTHRIVNAGGSPVSTGVQGQASLKEQMSSLSRVEITSLEEQVRSIQVMLGALPMGGWGVRMGLVLPDEGGGEPRAYLTTSFDHTLFSWEVGPNSETGLGIRDYMASRVNVMTGLEGVLRDIYLTANEA